MISREVVVDRIEGDLAVLVDGEGATFEIEVARLPAGTREGTVLSVPVREDRSLAWAAAAVDEAARKRRIQEAEATLRELRKRDPGGNVRL